MNTINDVNSINKTITTIGDITISHKVVVFRKQKMVTTSYPYMNEYKINNSESYYLRETKDYIVLTEGFGKFDSEERIERLKTHKKNSVLMTYSDISNIITLLNNASKWFTEDEYRNNLFKYDETGVPYAVSDKYENLCTLTNIVTGQDNFISIQPVVVGNALNSVGFPGVVIKCQTGVIGSCSMTEFMTLKRLLINLLDNLYSNSIALMDHFIKMYECGGLDKWDGKTAGNINTF